LIDTGFFPGLAAQIPGLIPGGEQLDAIFLTHGHPDHFGGLSSLYLTNPGAFPARVGHQAVKAEIAYRLPTVAGFWSPQQLDFDYQGNITVAAPNALGAIFGDPLSIQLDCPYVNAEADVGCTVYLPYDNVLLAGDLVYAHAHLYMGFNITADRLCEWLGDINELCAKPGYNMTTAVYPGHGTAIPTPTATSNLYTTGTENRNYLSAAQQIYLNTCNVTAAPGLLTAIPFAAGWDPTLIGFSFNFHVPSDANAAGCACVADAATAPCNNQVPFCAHRATDGCASRLASLLSGADALKPIVGWVATLIAVAMTL